jgi:hypothetical protein
VYGGQCMAGGGRRVACGVWHVVCGRQHMLAEIMTSVDMVLYRPLRFGHCQLLAGNWNLDTPC